MIRVLGRSSSSNVQKVLWCLAELDVAFEHEAEYGGPFGRTQEPDYLALNPNALVPTFIEDDFVLWESHTIVRYLGATHGQDTLWPSDPRDRALCERWMDWNQAHLDSAYFPAFGQLIRTAPADRDQSIIDQSVEAAGKRLRVLDKALAETGYVHGNRLTIGDIVFGPTLHRWFNLDIQRPDLKAVARWYDTMMRRPAYQRYVAVELS